MEATTSKTHDNPSFEQVEEKKDQINTKNSQTDEEESGEEKEDKWPVDTENIESYIFENYFPDINENHEKFIISNNIKQNIKLCNITFNPEDSIIINNKIYKILDLNVNEIKEYAKQSYFGHHDQYVFDSSVRKALEIKNFDITFLGNIIKQTNFINIEPYKINIYQENDFFKSHLDTKRKNLTHTMVLFIKLKEPDFEGGELLFNEIDYKFLPTEEFNAIIFPYYYPHEVCEITKGNRLTLTLNIYEYFEPILTDLKDKDPTIKPICNFKKLFKFFKDKHNIVCSKDYIYFDTFAKIFNYRYKTVYSFRESLEELSDVLYNEIETNVYETNPYLKNPACKPEWIIDGKTFPIEDNYRHYYGWRGNSPCSSNREFTYYSYAVFNLKDNISSKDPDHEYYED